MLSRREKKLKIWWKKNKRTWDFFKLKSSTYICTSGKLVNYV